MIFCCIIAFSVNLTQKIVLHIMQKEKKGVDLKTEHKYHMKHAGMFKISAIYALF